jgi:hypothetical protein
MRRGLFRPNVIFFYGIIFVEKDAISHHAVVMNFDTSSVLFTITTETDRR